MQNIDLTKLEIDRYLEYYFSECENFHIAKIMGKAIEDTLEGEGSIEEKMNYVKHLDSQRQDHKSDLWNFRNAPLLTVPDRSERVLFGTMRNSFFTDNLVGLTKLYKRSALSKHEILKNELDRVNDHDFKYLEYFVSSIPVPHFDLSDFVFDVSMIDWGKYIDRELGETEFWGNSNLKEVNEARSENQKYPFDSIEWGGSKVDLIEVARALYKSGRIIQSNESIKFNSLIELFEIVFNVELKKPYGQLSQRAKSKKGENFIEVMRSVIISDYQQIRLKEIED